MRDLLVGKTPNDKLRSAETILRRLQSNMANIKRPIPLSPFILSGYIETGVFSAYLPIDCTIGLIDVQVDEIAGDKNATATVSITNLSNLTTNIDINVKVGHTKVDPKYIADEPIRITARFDKVVKAWICIVAYPTIMRHDIVVTEEVEDEGV